MQNRYVGDIGDFGKYGLLSFQLQQNGRQLAKVSEGRIWFRTGARWNTALVINPNRRHTCLLRTEHVNIEAITDERSFRRQDAGSAERALKDLRGRLFGASRFARKEDVEELVNRKALELGSLAIL